MLAPSGDTNCKFYLLQSVFISRLILGMHVMWGSQLVVGAGVFFNPL